MSAKRAKTRTRSKDRRSQPWCGALGCWEVSTHVVPAPGCLYVACDDHWPALVMAIESAGFMVGLCGCSVCRGAAADSS